MPKLYSSAHIIRTLEQYGFLYVAQKGSHIKMRKYEGNKVFTVIVPANRKQIPHGTFRSIVRQSSLLPEYFA